jgi:two-component sensor histidine kinase
VTLEVHHRLKNTLSLVQAIAHGTFKSTAASEELTAFVARLQALASAQDVLIRSKWDSADVREVISRAIKPMPQSRMSLDGPTALLRPDGALALALAIHELCTNAAKYGAFATRKGRVDVQWVIDGPMLNLQWQESGGGPVTPPTQRGFGSRILKRMIEGQADGSVEKNFAPDGLLCRIRLPLTLE